MRGRLPRWHQPHQASFLGRNHVCRGIREHCAAPLLVEHLPRKHGGHSPGPENHASMKVLT